MSRMKTVEMLEKFDALLEKVGESVTRDQLIGAFETDEWALNAVYRARQRGDVIETIRGSGRIVTGYMRVSKANVVSKSPKIAKTVVVKTARADVKSRKTSAPVPEFIDNVTLDEYDREVKAA